MPASAPLRYRGRMDGLGSAASAGTGFGSLQAIFGERLTLVRDGNRAQWSLDGRSAVVEFRAGILEATFVERLMQESVSGGTAAPAYRGACAGYRLAPDGCARMVADMVAFFGGVREPRFEFAGLATGDIRA